MINSFFLFGQFPIIWTQSPHKILSNCIFVQYRLARYVLVDKMQCAIIEILGNPDYVCNFSKNLQCFSLQWFAFFDMYLQLPQQFKHRLSLPLTTFFCREKEQRNNIIVFSQNGLHPFCFNSLFISPKSSTVFAKYVEILVFHCRSLVQFTDRNIFEDSYQLVKHLSDFQLWKYSIPTFK